MGRDIFQNQRRFVRSGVLFISEVELDEQAKRGPSNHDMFQKIYTSQTHLLMEICARFSCNYLSTAAHELIKRKYEYTDDTYSAFADSYFANAGMKITPLTHEQYLRELDDLDEQLAVHDS